MLCIVKHIRTCLMIAVSFLAVCSGAAQAPADPGGEILRRAVVDRQHDDLVAGRQVAAVAVAEGGVGVADEAAVGATGGAVGADQAALFADVAEVAGLVVRLAAVQVDRQPQQEQPIATKLDL